MKKLFSTFLLSLTCAVSAGIGVACAKESETQQPQLGQFAVDFIDGEGFSYILENGEKAEDFSLAEGESFSFRLDVGAFYGGTPTVLANNVAIPSSDGLYTVTAKADTVITVNGIAKDVSNMIGTGAHDDAFLVTRPIDLVYIAEQVNAGNQMYSTAAYVLGNDIDCKGEELEIIGDLNNDQAFFSGVFSCYTNQDTGEMERYTISNFVINSDDSNYVGLFGCAQTNLTTTSSGMFYGIRLDNFVINASTTGMAESEEKSIYCGSLIGYGVGINSYLCEATNGEINIFADDNYFAFTGGLVGCQQGYYEQSYNLISASEIAYANVDVDVTVVKGVSLYAGGIIGYAFTNSFVAPAFIHNSYSTGTVSGAIRAGGIAGGLSQFTSIASCYSSGDVIAYAGNSTIEEYKKAYAGGLVGQLENDAIVNDCFVLGDVASSSLTSDTATNKYAFTGDFVGYADENGTASVNGVSHGARNCIKNLPENYESLGFYSCNWVFTDGQAPIINYETSAEEIDITLNVYFVTKDDDVLLKVNNVTKTSYTVTNSYEPIVNAFNYGALATYMKATAEGTATTGRNYLSYGYFFDRECTMPVPYSFVTMKTTDVYVGFADYSPVIGDYYFEVDGEQHLFTLTAEGMVEYQDGNANTVTRYQYDGETILFENVTFAKYFTGAVDTDLSVNEDANFDFNRYSYTAFEGKLNENVLSLYDGVYFVKNAPLTAIKGTPSQAPDFVLPTLADAYYDLSTKTFLRFENGNAFLTFNNGYSYELIYEKTNTEGYIGLFLVQEQVADFVTYVYKTPYGYFYYDETANALVALLLDPITGEYAQYTLLTVDEFEGDWVSENQLFGEIHFNGLGYHSTGSNYYGQLQIGDDVVPYSLNGSIGSFAYKGTIYEISYDTNTNTATVSGIILERKDEFASYNSFVAFDKNSFTQTSGFIFDGKSNLPCGGKLTMPDGAIYRYKNGKIYPENTTDFLSTANVGSIAIDPSNLFYLLTFTAGNHQGEYKLYPSNDLSGVWAMSGQFDAIEIGPADLEGTIYAKFKGVTVEITYLDPEVLYFETRLLDGMPVSYYLFLLYSEDGELTGFAMSEYSSLAYNVYTICSKADNFFGTWTKADDKFTMSFDGVAFDPSGRYSYGVANIFYQDKATPYYYIITDKINDNYIFEEGEFSLLMWSQNLLAERTVYYTLVACEPTDENAYTLTRNGVTYAFKRVEVDSLFNTKATDDNDVVYTFNGGNADGNKGTVTTSEGKSYQYKITEYKTNTVILELTDSQNNTYTATLDTTDSQNIKITLTQA